MLTIVTILNHSLFNSHLLNGSLYPLTDISTFPPLFSVVSVPMYNPNNSTQMVPLLHFSATLIISCLKGNHFNRFEGIYHCGFICISLMNDIEYLLMYIFWPLVCPLWKSVFASVHFTNHSIWVALFLLLYFEHILLFQIVTP